MPLGISIRLNCLDEARRRIAEPERQIKHLKSASGTQQIDQVAVERAVKSAVERERIAWQRKLEQGQGTILLDV